jgi:hypothetical protein
MCLGAVSKHLTVQFDLKQVVHVFRALGIYIETAHKFCTYD